MSCATAEFNDPKTVRVYFPTSVWWDRCWFYQWRYAAATHALSELATVLRVRLRLPRELTHAIAEEPWHAVLRKHKP